MLDRAISPVRAVSATIPTEPRIETGRPTFERKYVFPLGLHELLRSWMTTSLSPDPTFAFGRIASLYFDTPTLRFYQEKRNSDFLKTKVRLRWYEVPGQGDPVQCFLEVKRKTGALRTKVRTPLELPLGAIGRSIFSDPRILDLPANDPSLKGAPLLPLFIVRYDRERFIDPVTGCRVALDSRIGCSEVNPLLLATTMPVHLPMGVLETKGQDRALPLTIEPIAAYLKLAAFSKYACCCEHLMQPLDRRV